MENKKYTGEEILRGEIFNIIRQEKAPEATDKLYSLFSDVMERFLKETQCTLSLTAVDKDKKPIYSDSSDNEFTGKQVVENFLTNIYNK